VVDSELLITAQAVQVDQVVVVLGQMQGALQHHLDKVTQVVQDLTQLVLVTMAVAVAVQQQQVQQAHLTVQVVEVQLLQYLAHQ
jgi:hypothetical protein